MALSDSGNIGTTIVWFRNDLRTGDNLALCDAIARGGPVVALYIREEGKGARQRGAAQLWWLHHSLECLRSNLERLDIQLVLRTGRPENVLPEVMDEARANAVRWNRRYEPVAAERDAKLKKTLENDEVDVATFEGHLLHEPSQVRTGKGDFYRVYSPFWRALEAMGEPRAPIEAPPCAPRARAPSLRSENIADWNLRPTKPDWSGEIAARWTPGEDGAHKQLRAFISGAFDSYANGRDRPDREGTSRMSPHLAFGEITPYQIWRETSRRPQEVSSSDRTTYRKEVAWREFAYHLLFHNPDLDRTNFNDRFDEFPWAENQKAFRAWAAGRTGYPIVDAGMRQLWQTGWMHNRVRMIAASFLTKDLLIHWREGEAWFWDTLVDADPASNTAQWQWVAGSGADAAPYFRIFNPVLQGQKFDPDGSYVRTFVPELEKVDARYIHKPWEAPADHMAAAGVELGKSYPKPIVNHHEARQRALAAYEKIKDAA